MMLFAACLVVAGCQTRPSVTEPCDVLVVIPDAPEHVNRLLVTDARPTAQGLAMHRQRVQLYGCTT